MDKNNSEQKMFNDKIINEIFSEIEKDAHNDILYSENRKDKLCITIRNIIIKEKVYRNPNLNREMLIERLGINKDSFANAFLNCFGLLFSELIVGLRIKESVKLLKQTDLSIEEVAEKVGFGTVRTFQRQFQAIYNLSPKEYRKQAANY